MIGWLSQWLRDIVAVILLAAIVELLLPNKAMQRYARLVVGLIILLTILSPVLKLLQEDIGGRLEAGIMLWDERSIQKNTGMPSLEEITQKASQLQEQRSLEAARMTQRAMEGDITEQLAIVADLDVEKVDVDLLWEDSGTGGKSPVIGKVTVTLAAPSKPKPKSVEGNIAPVEPVSVSVTLEPVKEAGGKSQAAGDENNKYTLLKEQEMPEVWGMLRQIWGIKRESIEVRRLNDSV
ncbi:stage III sporulation protein AF [Paenibacillus sp. CAU 1782]